MKDFTHISVLLDRSGSMEQVRDETISGFNYFLAEQQKSGENASLTLVQFDTQGIDTVVNATPVRKVNGLNRDSYLPRGGTPLLDALGKTIVETGQYLSAIPESERPDKVVFVVITDGHENASHRYSRSEIFDMITHQREKYNWQFVYLGANQDAIAEATSFGMSGASAATYSTQNTLEAFQATASNVRSFSGTGDAASLTYSGAQRDSLLNDNDAVVPDPQSSGSVTFKSSPAGTVVIPDKTLPKKGKSRSLYTSSNPTTTNGGNE